MYVCSLGWRSVSCSRQGNNGRLWIGIPSRFLSSKKSQPPVNHYKVLGISSKATQAEIKASFYKLSKLFHPDVSDQSEETATKFRQITAAYEILGNLKLRKMYDRGLLPHHENVYPGVEDDYNEPEVKSPYKKTGKQPATGRTTIYDFDAWSRMHYGTAMNRKAAAKGKWHSQNNAREEINENTKSDHTVGLVLIGITIVALLHIAAQPNYDVPNDNKK
ncbi:dnaJ homolog subfamily C member 30, mitochondrial-like [Daphnia pulicaria]|jgi:DnaJ family protein C protein 30|uniref:dnaJ homolog subfamily C member 30, mitochondrial-like n=1 Tax=Daphnia pulicaria TaxID=35523 RepID=UPI001EEA0DA2|nr:dnaJ homolog subfamily C member 30, mitochondrial-like [Daphnia pulicaria]